MKNWFKLGAFVVLSCAVASAGAITYTEQQTGTGSLGTDSFTDALVTLTVVGDTTNIINEGSGLFFNTGTATVSVEGLGTATFTGDMQVFVFQNAVAGMTDDTLDADVLDTLNVSIGTYALAGSIGPISGDPLGNPTDSFPTTAGGFILSSSKDAGTPSTFTAFESTVPEPASLGLLGIGLAGLLILRRRGAVLSRG